MNFKIKCNLPFRKFSSILQNLRFGSYFFPFLTILSLFFTPAIAQDDNLRIAVAANLMLPMQEIKTLYESDFGSTLTLIPGSSGKLTAQILNGAPYDIFLAADMKYTRQIRREGHALDPAEVLLRGKLVLWSKEKPSEPLEAWLKKADIQSLGIAQPELAPYGNQAKEWLSEQGIYDTLLPQIVFGESVGQVNQYIRSGTVDVALTAVSAMYAKELKDQGYWYPLDFDSSDPSRLDHGIVLLSNATSDRETIDQFMEFIKSPLAEKVFLDYGYEIP